MTDFSTIENYINQLGRDEKEFLQSKNSSTSKPIQSINLWQKIFFIFRCFLDFVLLHVRFAFQNKKIIQKNIVFISPNLCNFNNNVCSIPLLENLDIDNILYINQSKEKHIAKIENQKVYNIGGLVNFLNNTIYKYKPSKSKSIYSHQLINDSFLKKLNKTNVFTLCYYDNNGLSIAFSNYRKFFNYTEVQHGSMINFYPYKTPANFAIVDTFYVRNRQTVSFLKSHLAKQYQANYNVIPYPKNNTFVQNGVHVLYASSIETNGFHTVFLDFLENNTIENLNLIIRLHPREYLKKTIFENDLKNLNIKYRFDESKNWILSNTIQNLIVVSPWSSLIEEAVDNNFKTIIIDEMGKKRFENYIDNENCFYSENINDVIKKFEQ